jgi:hypothetical protein
MHTLRKCFLVGDGPTPQTDPLTPRQRCGPGSLIRFISRCYTTVGELTRHISSHYGANPLDLYLTEDGKTLKDSERIKDQQLFLRTRLRGGTPPKRKSSRASVTLDVMKELYTIRQRLKEALLDHSTGQHDGDRQALVRESLQQLRERMWSKQHSLLTEIDRLLLAKNRTSISKDDLRKLHRPVPQPDTFVDANGRGWLNRDSKGTGTRLGSQISQNHTKGSEGYVSRRVRGGVDYESLRTRGHFMNESKGHHHLVNANTLLRLRKPFRIPRSYKDTVT